MSFEPPAGILDIGSATLRVGKLEVAETSGLNQGLQNIVKNDLLVTEKNESSPSPPIRSGASSYLQLGSVNLKSKVKQVSTSSLTFTTRVQPRMPRGTP